MSWGYLEKTSRKRDNMNYLKKIKDQLMGVSKRTECTQRDKVVVGARDLRELLDDYEQMDSFIRVQYENKLNYLPLEKKLTSLIIGLYHESHDEHRILSLVNDTLRSLVTKRDRVIETEKMLNK